MLIIALVLAAAGTRAGAQDRSYEATEAVANVKVAWADVLRVDPVYESVQNRTPREICDEVPVERRVDDGSKATGAVIGAIVGGVLGNTVGKGDGRKAATVAGAVVGGTVGHNVAQGGDRYYQDVEQHCRMVEDVGQEQRLVAYDVQYRYRGDVFMSRLDYDPGDRLRVRVRIEPAE
jgi:uncharacterized protein YcfJ